MFGFELLVGPYAVAHYRLHHALRRGLVPDGGPPGDLPPLPRLGVYLADTLAEPGAAAPQGPLGFVSEGIQDERREANRIKTEQPVLAIIGNPPYRRLEEGENRTLVGDWLDGVWDDLKEPVRDAGQGGQLNTFPELSVAFLRWAIWKLFEAENAPRRGVVALITNRKFLTGWPYAGLRQMMRRRFDRIEIIDLRGDVRRGERAGVESDQGVFNIQVGTAITLAIADGSKADGAAADIFYHDAWAEGLSSRRAKLEWLASGTEAGALANASPVVRGPLHDMRPIPFRNGEWVSIAECFQFRRSGLETKRDSLVYGCDLGQLERKIRGFLRENRSSARNTFHETRDRSFLTAHKIAFSADYVTRTAYRPLDTRYLYNQPAYGDFLRPELQEVWGGLNVSLYALPVGTGAGSAAWCHGLPPDRHAFRGSYGGYAFPLYDRRLGEHALNLSPALVASLGTVFGEAVSGEDVFDAILCLLSATSYTLRFAEDLEDVFPHVPFPAQHGVFREAARVGRAIRAIETFAQAPGTAYRRPAFCRFTTPPRGTVAAGEWRDGGITLCADGSGRMEGLPEVVWRFAVSGYRLLPRWIEARAGQPADLNLVRELRDVASRIAALIDLFAEADTVLKATLAETLTREALGL